MGDSDRESEVDALYQLTQSAEPFRDSLARPYVSFTLNGHREHHPVQSRAVRSWLQELGYEAFKCLPSREAVTGVLEKFESAALFEGGEHQVFVRIAEHQGAIYLDLADPEWTAVEITDAGWRVVKDPPVKFLRPRGVLPLPTPARGGSVDALARFLNFQPTDDGFKLIAAALVGYLRPRGPYPVLVLEGEQGSGKSTVSRVLGRLVDPNVCELRSEPHDVRDLMIGANNGHLLRYDNLSRIQPWLSDALCRVATGGGLALRQLYTDTEETLINVQRPILLNSIVGLVTRPDLLDRAIVVRLPHLPDARRRTEADFWTDFEQARPQILGALLETVVVALRDVSSVQLRALPRMADFAVWAVAAESALPWTKGDFLRAYEANRHRAAVSVLDDDPLVDALRDLIAAKPQPIWIGTATELRDSLLHRNGLPRFDDPRQVMTVLRRLTPALRHAGIDVDFDWPMRHGGKKQLAISAGGKP